MAAYIVSDVGHVSSEDEAAWNAYLAQVPTTIMQYGGRYLARGGVVDVMEGDWSASAMVIVEFPSREAAMRWYKSPEYAEGLKIRSGSGLHRRLLCVDGVKEAEPVWEQGR